jgi:ribosome-associated protein
MEISSGLRIPDDEIEFVPIRAQGSGGQNVNKVSSAIHLRFDVNASSLPEGVKVKLLALSDSRISKEGIVVIKAQTHRTQEKNRAAALDRLKELVRRATVTQKKRVPTKPSRSSQRKRVDGKTKRGQLKKLRGKVSE